LADCDASLRIAVDPRTLNIRGLVHLRRGAWQSALDDFDAAVSGNANLTDPLYGRGMARLRLGRTAQGDADLAAAIARDPGVASGFAEYGISR
jgi:Flp pilus assembly protein TadD